MDMDYIAIAKAFFAATGIPVTLMRNQCIGDYEYGEARGDVVFSSMEYMANIPAKKLWTTFRDPHNPIFCRTTPGIEYGMLRIEGTDLALVVGPLFSIPVTDEMVSFYLLDSQTPPQYRSKVADALSSIPVASHSRFAWLLAFLHMALNRKDFQLDTLHDITGVQSEVLFERALASRVERMETEELHNTWDFERQFYALIRDGDVGKLGDFLERSAMGLREGRYAASPLRHAKNLFIINISKLVALSAIPGGMDVERAYQLMDTYIQECEQLSTLEAVSTLQRSMVRDFCTQIGEAKLPKGISREVFSAINYIRCHICTPISVDDVSRHIRRSTSFLVRRFKQEMGCTVGEYATQCRLEEAKSLLRHSDKPLSEISSYLCFSSQAYFQNVFRKAVGMTPMQYRKHDGKE